MIQNLQKETASVHKNNTNIYVVQSLLWNVPNSEKHDQPEVYVVQTCKETTTNCTILETEGSHTEYNLTLPLHHLMKYSVSVAGKSGNNTGPCTLFYATVMENICHARMQISEDWCISCYYFIYCRYG